jgi:hypothetical protein
VNQDTVEKIAKMLHQYHGRGYCSMGDHSQDAQYACRDEARAILAAIEDKGPADYPQRVPRIKRDTEKRAPVKRTKK